MLDKLKEEVFKANMDLVKHNLVILTWGNVSGIDREQGLIVIKPSGVSYDTMKVTDMVVIDLDGNVIDGKYKPSSDTKTHIELYKAFEKIGGIVHTHSPMATSFAQASCGVKPMGTTHADYFYGEIPCTRQLTIAEIESDYEKATGEVIIETFKDIDYMAIPAVLIKEHGPFSWGKNPHDAVYHSIVLEEVCKMSYNSVILNPKTTLQSAILDKHYNRKHGTNSYYGQ